MNAVLTMKEKQIRNLQDKVLMLQDEIEAHKKIQDAQNITANRMRAKLYKALHTLSKIADPRLIGPTELKGPELKIVLMHLAQKCLDELKSE